MLELKDKNRILFQDNKIDRMTTYAEVREDGLYFSCTLPHLIVGTVGNGKHLPHVEEALTRLGCREEREPGENARRLATITAATVRIDLEPNGAGLQTLEPVPWARPKLDLR